MFEALETAHTVHLRDRRKDSLRALGDAVERLTAAAGSNDLLQAALEEALPRLVEAQERLRDWCPDLFGPLAPRFIEQCCCWRCGCSDFDQPFCDPFED